MVKAKMAKAIANNGNINVLKLPHKGIKDRQQQRAEKKGIKRHVSTTPQSRWGYEAAACGIRRAELL